MKKLRFRRNKNQNNKTSYTNQIQDNNKLKFLQKIIDQSYHLRNSKHLTKISDYSTLDSLLYKEESQFELNSNIYLPFFDFSKINKSTKSKKNKKFNSLLVNWIESNYNSDLIPTNHFDSDYYKDSYPDVIKSELSPYFHFILFGNNEQRVPSHNYSEFISSLNVDRKLINKSSDYFIFFNKNIVDAISQNDILSYIKKFFRRNFYEKVALDNGFDLVNKDVFSHFIDEGILLNLRPSYLFNQEYYLNKLRLHYEDTGSLDLTNFILYPFAHWCVIGRKERIVPTPLFDAEYYSESNKDLSNWSQWIFDHFLWHGEKERRIVSPLYNLKFIHDRYILENGNKYSSWYALEFYFNFHLDTKVFPANNVVIPANIENQKYVNINEDSLLEQETINVWNKTKKLSNSYMTSLIEDIYELEPMILRPTKSLNRFFQFPPLKHELAHIPHLINEALNSLKFRKYDIIILIPHCRMAGSAKIAGYFSKIIEKISDDNQIKALVISTDKEDFDRLDWFSDKIEILRISQLLSHYNDNFKINFLLDLVRGLNPDKIININSNLCWRLYRTYGNALSKLYKLYIYLFCWDLDIEGRRGGYPIQWLNFTINFLYHIYTDSLFLRDYINRKYLFDGFAKQKVTTLHTPYEPSEFKLNKILFKRHNKKLDSIKRCFWSGRFDRQKRFDVVIEIANKIPDLEILVYGKQVMNDYNLEEMDIPRNIKFCGVYKEFEEIPLMSCDFFLYTAEWDGLPTVLIEVAARSIPIVSCDVGGISDLLNESNAYIVKEFDSPGEYVNKIYNLYNDAALAAQKAEQLGEDVKELCDDKKFESAVIQTLGYETNK